MLKSEEQSNPDSTLNKALPDEPLFIIRGQDMLAAKTIRDWGCRLLSASNETRRIGNVDLANRQRDKAAQAFEFAGVVEAWQTCNAAKLPD